MPDLSIVVDGLKLPNPFVVASGPQGTNANVIGKAYDEGWGAVICKTVSLDAAKVVNVQPRYARLRAAGSDEIIGWENIELISDRPFATWVQEFKQIKDRHPDQVLIASIIYSTFCCVGWLKSIGKGSDFADAGLNHESTCEKVDGALLVILRLNSVDAVAPSGITTENKNIHCRSLSQK